MAEHLPSLKAKPSSSRGSLATEAPDPPQDFFPVSTHVSDEQVAAMALGDVNVGDERMLMAMVRVTSVSEHESSEGKTKSVSLDLIEGTTTPKAAQKDAAKLLFGE